MERRLLVVLSAIAVAVVAVGLSAAATMSRSEPVDPSKKPQASKSAKKAAANAPRRSTNEPATVSSGQGQSTKEVESYWTKERMEDAQPRANTRQETNNGGSPSSAPAPSGNTVPGSLPNRKPTPQRSSAKKPRSAGDAGVSTTPAATPNPGYWTDEAMDGAQPLDKTRPGGSGSQDSPDPGGDTVPGSPPP